MALFIVSKSGSSRYYKIGRTRVSRNELITEVRNSSYNSVQYYKITDDEVLAHDYVKSLVKIQRVNNEEVYEYSLTHLTNVCNKAIEEVQKTEYMDVDSMGGFPFAREDPNSPKKFFCTKCPKRFAYYGQIEDHFKLDHYQITKDDVLPNKTRPIGIGPIGTNLGVNRNMGMNVTPKTQTTNNIFRIV